MVPYHPLRRIHSESIQKCYHIKSSNITELYPCIIIIHHKRYNDTKISLPKMCESLKIINYGLIKKINADYATLPRFDSIYISLLETIWLSQWNSSTLAHKNKHTCSNPERSKEINEGVITRVSYTVHCTSCFQEITS